MYTGLTEAEKYELLQKREKEPSPPPVIEVREPSPEKVALKSHMKQQYYDRIQAKREAEREKAARIQAKKDKLASFHQRVK